MNQENARELLRDLEPMKPETALKIEIDDNLELVLDKITEIYEQKLEKSWRYARFGLPEFFHRCFLSLKNIDISKEAFNRFFAGLPAHDDHENFYENTGLFVSALVQAAYARGCNDFKLDTRPIEKDVGWLLNCLRGTEKERLMVSVIGNLGFRGCADLTNASITVEGNVGSHFATDVRFCDVQLSGIAVNQFGNYAKHSYLRVFGEAENMGIFARNSVFAVFGEPGKYAISRSINSVLKCTSLEALKQVRRDTPKCELYYLQEDGTEISYNLLAKKSVKPFRK